jgi:hypothetical protein
MLSATRGMSYLQPINNRCKVSMFFVLTVFEQRPQVLAAILQSQLYCLTPKELIPPAIINNKCKFDLICVLGVRPQ